MSLLVIHLVACAFMTGLIWVIQLLHYPAFAQVDESQFADFHRQHSTRITWIVAPVMTLELGTGIGLLFFSSAAGFFATNISLIILTWLATGILSVPCHQILSERQDLRTIQKLVTSNWLRTILWTLRLCILIAWYLNEELAT
jgi:uncharacterized membrane protein